MLGLKTELKIYDEYVMIVFSQNTCTNRVPCDCVVHVQKFLLAGVKGTRFDTGVRFRNSELVIFVTKKCYFYSLCTQIAAQ